MKIIVILVINGSSKNLLMINRFEANAMVIEWCFKNFFVFHVFFCTTNCSFVSDFGDWQHLNPRLPNHEINSLLKQNCINWKELEKRLLDDKTIDCKVQKMFKNAKEKWRNILK